MQFSYDIAIDSDCSRTQNSGCNLGYTFRPPKNAKHGSQEAKNYLGGRYNFRVAEIEVYKVIFN